MFNAEMKFVVFNGHHGEQIVVFPKIIQHSVMAEDVHKSSFGGMRPISGGFIVDGECVGESESLGMKSRPEDTSLLQGLVTAAEHSLADEHFSKERKKPMTKNQAKRARKKSKG
jgi:hypothetical protein